MLLFRPLVFLFCASVVSSLPSPNQEDQGSETENRSLWDVDSLTKLLQTPEYLAAVASFVVGVASRPRLENTIKGLVNGITSSWDFARWLLEKPDECSPFQGPLTRLLSSKRQGRLFHPKSVVTDGQLEQTKAMSIRNMLETPDRFDWELWGVSKGLGEADGELRGEKYRAEQAKGFPEGLQSAKQDKYGGHSEWRYREGFLRGQKFGGKTREGMAYLQGYNRGFHMGKEQPNAPNEALIRGFENGLCLGYCIQQFQLELTLRQPDWVDTTLQQRNDWMLRCLEVLKRRQTNAEAKALRESKNRKGKNYARTEGENIDRNNNKMQTTTTTTTAGLWPPLKAVGEKVRNGLTKIANTINSVHAGNTPKLSSSPPAPAPIMKKPGIGLVP